MSKILNKKKRLLVTYEVTFTKRQVIRKMNEIVECNLEKWLDDKKQFHDGDLVVITFAIAI